MERPVEARLPSQAHRQETLEEESGRRNPKKDETGRKWLGGRDSNPDNVVQSHVSYR